MTLLVLWFYFSGVLMALAIGEVIGPHDKILTRAAISATWPVWVTTATAACVVHVVKARLS